MERETGEAGDEGAYQGAIFSLDVRERDLFPGEWLRKSERRSFCAVGEDIGRFGEHHGAYRAGEGRGTEVGAGEGTGGREERGDATGQKRHEGIDWAFFLFILREEMQAVLPMKTEC